jgi:hypothetical protein
MVAYTHYETDNRVRRYAEELARRGDRVDVVALSAGDGPPTTEEINGVTLHRIQSRKYDERHKSGLDEKAIECLQQLRFKPATNYFSEPVTAKATVEGELDRITLERLR